jgi:ribosomal protein S18 acetylase RimI-like enzyme
MADGTSALRVIEADLADPDHRAAVLAMTRAYARDPMGNGADLPESVREVLVDRLRAHPTSVVFLALDGDRAVGIATCFVGFSTFAARPLLNVHDIHVLPEHQRRGVGRALLEAVEAEARRRGCCKLTLEVLESNHPAAALYESFGFVGSYEPGGPIALFRQKKL